MNKIVKFHFFPILLAASVVFLYCNTIVYSGIKVYPRLITPGVTASNENAFFDFDDFSEPKPELKIFDLTGRVVRSIQVLNPMAIATGWRLVGTGKMTGAIWCFPAFIYTSGGTAPQRPAGL